MKVCLQPAGESAPRIGFQEYLNLALHLNCNLRGGELWSVTEVSAAPPVKAWVTEKGWRVMHPHVLKYLPGNSSNAESLTRIFLDTWYERLSREDKMFYVKRHMMLRAWSREWLQDQEGSAHVGSTAYESHRDYWRKLQQTWKSTNVEKDYMDQLQSLLDELQTLCSLPVPPSAKRCPLRKWMCRKRVDHSNPYNVLQVRERIRDIMEPLFDRIEECQCISWVLGLIDSSKPVEVDSRLPMSSRGARPSFLGDLLTAYLATITFLDRRNWGKISDPFDHCLGMLAIVRAYKLGPLLRKMRESISAFGTYGALENLLGQLPSNPLFLKLAEKSRVNGSHLLEAVQAKISRALMIPTKFLSCNHIPIDDKSPEYNQLLSFFIIAKEACDREAKHLTEVIDTLENLIEKAQIDQETVQFEVPQNLRLFGSLKQLTASFQCVDGSPSSSLSNLSTHSLDSPYFSTE